MPSPNSRPVPARALATALTVCVALAVSVGCRVGSEPGTTPDGRPILRYQGTTGKVEPFELAADLGYFRTIQLDWQGDSTSGPAMIQAVATRQAELGSAFNGAVAKLIAGGAKATSVLSSYGADDQTFTGYFVRDGAAIGSARDLIGKKVGVNTLGAPHELITREWLHRQGLSDDEIKQVQFVVLPPVSTEDALRKGQIDLAALSDAYRDTAVARGGVHSLFTDKDLFGTFDYGSYVFRDEYIAEHPDAVHDFVQGTARAIRWMQVTPRDEVVARMAAIIGKRGRNESTRLLQYWHSSGIPVPGGVIEERELQTWIDWLVRNGELRAGKLTARDLYTNSDNPYADGTYAPTSGPTGEVVAAK